eukprot:SRR837773.13335.p1 GENE.SRR837773.13335~~SRR837773.13335.p1  ORF type:complete len:469 (+),score=82.06 SRR837773.13335:74-1408(+)
MDVTALSATALDGEPGTRSYQLDLRLLEAPGASASLEVEARVWARGGSTSGTASRGAPRDDVSCGETLLGPPAAGQQVDAGALTMAVPPGGSSPLATIEVQPAPSQMALLQEAKELRLNQELTVQLAKEFNLRAAALKRAGNEIVELRRQVQMLRHENARLQAQLDDETRLAEDVKMRPLPEGLDSLSGAELAAKLQRALEKYREEKTKGAELSRRLEDMAREATRCRGLERSLDELEKAHVEQNRELQRLQEENKKIDTYRKATKTQEQVIAKLEKILENSLHEVQKAQKVQVDVERMKTENMRLREKCAMMVSKRKGDSTMADPSISELQRQLSAKRDEVVRLKSMVAEMQHHVDAGVPGQASADLARERANLEEQASRALDWEQRCQAAEHRLQMLQHQVTESSKRYGAEISALKVEVAKRDARVMELEFLLRERGAGDSL